VFGRSMTPAERLRQHQRSLQKAQRELEREAQKLEQQEKKTMMDIKKNAKAGNMVSLGSSYLGSWSSYLVPLPLPGYPILPAQALRSLGHVPMRLSVSQRWFQLIWTG
jgi:hypothetical protein